MLNNSEPWKILIVDDDKDVHLLTRMVLEGFSFENKGLSFISAYSGLEALEMIREHPDIALIFLDVVMETDDAGFKVVNEIREGLNNKVIQIILRTGQAGQAPEEDVVSKYDINEYVSKVKITASHMTHMVASSLKAFSLSVFQ